jgi:hypothetical protein
LTSKLPSIAIIHGHWMTIRHSNCNCGGPRTVCRGYSPRMPRSASTTGICCAAGAADVDDVDAATLPGSEMAMWENRWWVNPTVMAQNTSYKY